MDQPILCQDLIHVIKHPLSILIHSQFQDKDGCSRNGSLKVMLNFNLFSCWNNMTSKSTSPWGVKLDHRGVILSCNMPIVPGRKAENEIVKWKNVLFPRFKSSIPICHSEAHILRQLKDHWTITERNRLERFINDPGGNFSSDLPFKALDGHLIEISRKPTFRPIQKLFTPTNHSIQLCAQFPHLRSLHYSITNQETVDGFILFSPLSAGNIRLSQLSFEVNFFDRGLQVIPSLSTFSSNLQQFTTLRQLKLRTEFDITFMMSFFFISDLQILLNLIYCCSYFHNMINRINFSFNSTFSFGYITFLILWFFTPFI